MLVRFAVLAPLAGFLAWLPFIVGFALSSERTGLAEGQRTWFYLFMPATYFVLIAYVSAVYACLVVGPERLPRWVAFLAGKGLKPPESVADFISRASGWQQFRVAIGLLLQLTVWLAITVPVFAILVAWLFVPGIYRPWEAAMVAAAALATVAWVAFLAWSYRNSGKA